MARVMLILPTSTYRAADFLAAARAAGVEVVTASEERQALASSMGSRFVQLPVDDAASAAAVIEDFAREVRLDAVVAVDDRGGLAAALAGRALGLVANDPAAVAATTNKAALRARLETAGVRQPRHALVVLGAEHPARVVDAARHLGFPVVVKPVSLAASRGVMRADDEESAALCATRLAAILAECGREHEPVLVETFVPGAELALEGMLSGGSLETLCLFDKPDPLDGPFFEETIYVAPARVSDGERRATEELVGAACAALGLFEGPIHAEVRLTPEGQGRAPVLIEVASRTIGGRCARALRFATGESLEDLVLAHALGERRPAPRLDGAVGVMMLPIPHSGCLRRVGGRDEALAVPGIVGLEMAIPLGQRVVALPEGDRYLGFLFAAGEGPDGVEAALRAGHAALGIEIEREPVAEPAP